MFVGLHANQMLSSPVNKSSKNPPIYTVRSLPLLTSYFHASSDKHALILSFTYILKYASHMYSVTNPNSFIHLIISILSVVTYTVSTDFFN